MNYRVIEFKVLDPRLQTVNSGKYPPEENMRPKNNCSKGKVLGSMV